MLTRILLTGGVVSLTSIFLYVRYLHQSLRSQIKSTKVTAEERKGACASGEIEYLPPDLIERPQDFRILHVQDEKISSVSVPAKEGGAKQLFTKLLRRNNSCFSRTPQSYILRMMAKTPEQKQSFSRSHIESLNFEEGDLFCGFNRVLKRDPLRCEIELVPPEGMGSFSGRLVFGLDRHSEGTVLKTQTLQWTKKGDSTVLPLERGPAKFLHEMASWWLLVSGEQYLRNISGVS